MPVFSLVLDRDVPAKIALTYPELYKELTKGRSLSYKTFFLWVAISIYQGRWSGYWVTWVGGVGRIYQGRWGGQGGFYQVRWGG